MRSRMQALITALRPVPSLSLSLPRQVWRTHAPDRPERTEERTRGIVVKYDDFEGWAF